RLNPINEDYPAALKAAEIAVYLAELKASALRDTLHADEILITSDTVVWHQKEALAKPGNREEALAMLQRLSGDVHEVITAVSFTTTTRQRTIHQVTQVAFKILTDDEILYYIDHFHPFDKAGGYGIQDWIGLIGIKEIKGSYFNVMGLPTHVVYKTLMDIAG
ncbi:MAG TPA: Maf family protein, partial [Eudoraea sp.]|nr:Maf family protein [Eudoraea sp.]